VVCIPSDVQVCHRTLSRIRESGRKAYIIVVKNQQWSRQRINHVKDVARKSRVTGVFYRERFDFSQITQGNVKSLERIIQGLSPSVIIMPFVNSSNKFRRIVGWSSLLASRSVRNILMYDLDTKNVRYNPNVFVKKSKSLIDSTQGARMVVGSDIQKELADPFMCHRVVLNDDLIDVLSDTAESRLASKY